MAITRSLPQNDCMHETHMKEACEWARDPHVQHMLGDCKEILHPCRAKRGHLMTAGRISTDESSSLIRLGRNLF